MLSTLITAWFVSTDFALGLYSALKACEVDITTNNITVTKDRPFCNEPDIAYSISILAASVMMFFSLLGMVLMKLCVVSKNSQKYRRLDLMMAFALLIIALTGGVSAFLIAYRSKHKTFILLIAPIALLNGGACTTIISAFY